jgi:hypothetical protein
MNATIVPKNPCCSWCDCLLNRTTDVAMDDGSFMHLQCYYALLHRDAVSDAQDRLIDEKYNDIYKHSSVFTSDLKLLQTERPGRFEQIIQMYRDTFE